ncbi:hypothetical protein ABT336_17435 [Micromonospora sp. NPDC000207]|uniref:hypothetical protein n=1 Tax=Micromonospora sp. NPDC000207 TaxID=3154246 RepID=UPI00331B9BF8
MATPTVTARLNKSTFVTGEPMVLTVGYADADSRPVTVTVVVTDADGNSSVPVRVRTTFDQLTVTVTDDSARAWTSLSDDGSTARYQAVA